MLAQNRPSSPSSSSDNSFSNMKRKRDDSDEHPCDDDGGSELLLMDAAKNGDVALVTAVFETGHDVNVNVTDANGLTALGHACECDSDDAEEVARLLVEHGADVNVRGRDARDYVRDTKALSPLIILACC